jgi:hypothetical protein
VIARKTGKRVELYSRPGNDLTYRFPLIVEALAGLRLESCILDGRWFWSITRIIQVPRGQSVITNARAPTLEAAKGQFMANWLKCRAFAG